eukprot:325674-Hanusia_phi.AAC.2
MSRVKELVDLLILYDKHFHEIGEPLVSDLEYDALKDELYELDPKNKYFKKIGEACITDKTKLPYYMGSLDKIKDDNEKGLNNFIKKYKGEYNISDKLDGISALLIKKDGKLNLFTRGDGTFGRDVSDILKHIKYVPENLEENDALRGELIIPKSSWNKSWGKAYPIKENENPKYAIAFKSMTTLDEALVIVKDIEWNQQDSMEHS